MNSRIVSAANKMHCADGQYRLLIGARHWDSHMRAQAKDLIELLKLKGYLTVGKSEHSLLREGNEEQGFIDQFGNFYTRKEAWVIAEVNNQIIRDVGSTGSLYSENLY